MASKMKSRRWWIVVWAICFVSILAFVCVKFNYDAAWVAGTMAIVSAVPASYVTVSTIRKKEGQ